MANDVEALEEYIKKYTMCDDMLPGGHGDVFEEAINHGSLDVYRRLFEYQKAQAAAGSTELSPPYMPLHKACEARQVDMVRYLLSISDDVAADLATADRDRTPLLSACFALSCTPNSRRDPATAHCRSEEIVGILLDHGAGVQDRAYWPYQHLEREDGRKLCNTALSLAIPRVGPALLRRLIDLGAPLHAPLGFQSYDRQRVYEDITLMHIAATYANCDAVEILLGTPEGREMARMRDGLGRLPIHWAAQCGAHDLSMIPDQDTTRRAAATIKLLLPHSPINDSDASGNTPLHLATTFSSHEWVVRGEEEGGPPSFRNAVTHLLLENGADAALRNHKGETALGLITRTRYNPAPTELLADLLAHGAAPINGAADAQGNTPLHHAARELPRSLGTVRFLLEQGADPGVANADGDTPAHIAPRSQADRVQNYTRDASREIEEVLDLFAAASGDPNLRDRLNAAGLTPRGILNEERANLARRIEEEEERTRKWLTICRGRGRGRGGP